MSVTSKGLEPGLERQPEYVKQTLHKITLAMLSISCILLYILCYASFFVWQYHHPGYPLICFSVCKR
jgi:hypothetical protein